MPPHNVLGFCDVVIEEAEDGLALSRREAVHARREARVDEQGPLPCLWMHAHHGTHGGQRIESLRGPTGGIGPRLGGEDATGIVNRLETIAEVAERWGRGLVRVDEVRPQDVTPALGDHRGVQQRPQWRGLYEGDVRGPLVLPGVAVPFGDGRGLLDGVEHQDLGLVVETRGDRVSRGQLVELRPEFDQLSGWPRKKRTRYSKRIGRISSAVRASAPFVLHTRTHRRSTRSAFSRFVSRPQAHGGAASGSKRDTNAGRPQSRAASGARVRGAISDRRRGIPLIWIMWS